MTRDGIIIDLKQSSTREETCLETLTQKFCTRPLILKYMRNIFLLFVLCSSISLLGAFLVTYGVNLNWFHYKLKVL